MRNNPEYMAYRCMTFGEIGDCHGDMKTKYEVVCLLPSRFLEAGQAGLLSFH